MLWDLNESKHLYSLEAGDIINALVFSPNRYWLCAATASCIKIFDLESKSIVDELKPDFAAQSTNAREPECMSLAWSADGQVSPHSRPEIRPRRDQAADPFTLSHQTLFAGYTDNLIRVYTVV